ncbi:DUF3099 domain-containing protein [Gulosibacter molinativorax]|nr:DUF3099 domain-containing protein [Gulosibacter molinativorax]QUY61494.1 Hypotetical protein [Gulosibacter molinativorax]
MSRQVPNITSIGESEEEERRHRTRQYLLTMAFRSVCVLLMVFVRGPMLFVVAAGAIFLPWIAVVIANHVRERKIRPVERPDAAAVVKYAEPVRSNEWYEPRDSANDDAPSSEAKDGGATNASHREEKP